MIRNFTQDNQNRVTRLFVAINPDNNDEIATQAQRIRGKYSSALGRIGGSSLIEAIIRDNRQMAAMKRSAAQRLGVNFNNMVALDRPYGQSTFDRLTSLLNALIAFQDVIGVATNDVKTGGINRLDPKTFIASLLTISDVDYRHSEDISPEQLIIDKLRMELETAKSSGNVAAISPFDTRNAYEYLIYSNYDIDPNDDIFNIINNNREIAHKIDRRIKKFGSRDPDSSDIQNLQCATYTYNMYYRARVGGKDPTPISSYLFNINRDTTNYANPQYAAFVGGYIRDQYDYNMKTENGTTIKEYTTLKKGEQPANKGKLGTGVLMAVTIHKDEGIQYKTPGSTEFVHMDGTEGMPLEKQLQIIKDAGIIKENDIVYFIDEYGTDSKTGQPERYPPEIGQTHVGAMSTSDTYAAANDYVYKRPLTKATETHDGMSFVILNSDEDTLDEMRSLYGGQ